MYLRSSLKLVVKMKISDLNAIVRNRVPSTNLKRVANRKLKLLISKVNMMIKNQYSQMKMKKTRVKLIMNSITRKLKTVAL